MDWGGSYLDGSLHCRPGVPRFNVPVDSLLMGKVNESGWGTMNGLSGYVDDSLCFSRDRVNRDSRRHLLSFHLSILISGGTYAK